MHLVQNIRRNLAYCVFPIHFITFQKEKWSAVKFWAIISVV
jgi:hypothetical protein